jgi:deoxyadenosine/deoxycytidine kinase
MQQEQQLQQRQQQQQQLLQRTITFPQHINYVCVEGVIGVGKTSLCEMLGRHLGANLILEDVDGNPFLQKFYSDRKAFAFQTQLWFLLSRMRQLSEPAAQPGMEHCATVSDYMFAKNGIFAEMNLSGDELALYASVADMLGARLPRPDLVVYLQASTDTLMRRIEKRARPFEKPMDEAYVSDLNKAYDNFFFSYTASPLLIINTNEIDFADHGKNFFEVAEQIVNAGPGTNVYNPMVIKA